MGTLLGKCASKVVAAWSRVDEGRNRDVWEERGRGQARWESFLRKGVFVSWGFLWQKECSFLSSLTSLALIVTSLLFCTVTCMKFTITQWHACVDKKFLET